MKALVKSGAGPGLTLQEVPELPLGPRSVRIRVEAAAICGTDIHIYHWNAWAQKQNLSLPLIVGHEFSGRVLEVGPEVRRVKAGDKVAGESHAVCGQCYQCLNGMQHICANVKVLGVHMPGVFCQEAVVPEECACPVPEEMPWEQAAVLEPLGVGVHATKAADVGGTSTVVIGCGPIGLGAIAAARAMGASPVVGVDVSDYRLGLGRRFGADVVVNPAREDVVALVRNLTAGVGADVIIECSGSVQAMTAAFSYLRKGGRMMMVGLPDAPLTLDLTSAIVFKGATVRGFHGREMYATWTQMERLISGGRIDPSLIVTHRFRLEEFEQAFAVVSAGQAGKVILLPNA